MSIFRRRKADAETTVDTGTGTGGADVSEQDDDVTEAESAEVVDATVDRSAGPFDATEVDDDDGRLDLGALRLQGRDGMELRLEVDPEQQHVIAATAVIGESAIQMQAFAAPRTGGLWADIRSEIAESIATQGGTADVEPGDLGAELRPACTAPPGRPHVFAPRPVPRPSTARWFLRGVISGRGAIDDEAAAPLLEIFRNTVVVRGSDPMAPRELLPLRLPQEDAAPMPDVAPSELPTTSTDDLNPFERGPEITEVR